MRSDAELVTATITGDTSAFEELVRRYERSAGAVAFHVMGDHHDAQDVVQDAFVAVYRSLASLRDGNAFGPWLATTTRRLAHAAAHRRPQTAALTEMSHLPAPQAESDVDSERLLAEIMALPERESQILMLRHFDGHDVALIAEITGEGIGTVTKRLSRAHAHLRERLEGKVL